MVCFLLIFRRFKCECFAFQAFTRAVKAFTRAVNTCEGLQQQAFTPENRWQSEYKRNKRPLWCEGLKNQAFTLQPHENQEKIRAV